MKNVLPRSQRTTAGQESSTSHVQSLSSEEETGPEETVLVPPWTASSDKKNTLPPIAQKSSESLVLFPSVDEDERSDMVNEESSSAFRKAGNVVVAMVEMKSFRKTSSALQSDLVRAFVPDILFTLLKGKTQPLEPQAKFMTAACMCADISGFTALSERHCQNGTEGLDTLVQIINSYYSNLVNIVYSFGGDIIKIAGDALYCIFIPDAGDVRGAVLCAALCSMELREVAANGLTLHVGISSGTLCFGVLGGIQNYWECLMSGEPISTVAGALDEAKKQEVVLSSESVSIIGDCCEGITLPSRNLKVARVTPPQREKRGSLRVSQMVTCGGLWPLPDWSPPQGHGQGQQVPLTIGESNAVQGGEEGGGDNFAGSLGCTSEKGEPTAAAGCAAPDAAATLVVETASTPPRLVSVDQGGGGMSDEGNNNPGGQGMGGGGVEVEKRGEAEAEDRCRVVDGMNSSNAGRTDSAEGREGGREGQGGSDRRAETPQEKRRGCRETATLLGDASGGTPGMMAVEPGSLSAQPEEGTAMTSVGIQAREKVADQQKARDEKNSPRVKRKTTIRRSDTVLPKGVKIRESVSPEMVEVILGFVPGPVSEMLSAGIFTYMAEMRTVTTVFMKLDSYNPDQHKDLLSLQIHLTTAQTVLAEHEGFLRQFLVDDKGCVLIACWGVPGRSYSDNCYRGLSAAVEMHQRLAKKDMRTSIGVTTGHALCGRVGGKIRSEYAMVGDVINLAARLMGKAKGRIICDAVTHSAVSRKGGTEAQFKRLDPMKLKGKENLISPFVCLAQQGSDLWENDKQTRMIGRTQLQNKVNELLDGLGAEDTEPQPVVVVIEGAHGTGKVGDDAIAIRDSLRKTVASAFMDDEDTALNVAYPAILTVMSIDLKGETEEAIIPKTEDMVMSEMMSKSLEMEPHVFILEDVHLMDEMSWKLLLQLLKSRLWLLVVLTATPVEEYIKKRKELQLAKAKAGRGGSTSAALNKHGSEGLYVWQRPHGDTHLHMQHYIRATQLHITTKFVLEHFNREEVRQLLRATLEPQKKIEITEDLVKSVYGISGGNPFWCVEIVKFVLEHGVQNFINRIGGTLEEANGEMTTESTVMNRMGVLVVCRFERLLLEEQSVIRYASVAGMEFSIGLLEEVMPLNIRVQLELIIQALVTARFLVHSRHSFYKFRDSMVHMVLYNLTPASRRKRIHKAVADYYIHKHKDDPLYLPVVCYHLLKAEVEISRTVEFLCKTAAHALVCFCFKDCLEALEKAVKIVSSADEIHEVLSVHHHIRAMHLLGHTTNSDGKETTISSYNGAYGTLGGSTTEGEPSEADTGNGTQGEDETFLRTDSLDVRINTLGQLVAAAHTRLCALGDECEVAIEWSTAGSEGPAGTVDLTETMVSIQDEEGGGDGTSNQSSMRVKSHESSRTPSGRSAEPSKVVQCKSGLNWGVAGMLQTKLSFYLEPGSERPQSPENEGGKASPGRFSVHNSKHRLPSLDTSRGGNSFRTKQDESLELLDPHVMRVDPFGSPGTLVGGARGQPPPTRLTQMGSRVINKVASHISSHKSLLDYKNNTFTRLPSLGSSWATLPHTTSNYSDATSNVPFHLSKTPMKSSIEGGGEDGNTKKASGRRPRSGICVVS